MARAVTVNADKTPPYSHNVTFISEKGEKLTRSFEFKSDAYRFVCKLRYSKRCKLVSYPLFN